MHGILPENRKLLSKLVGGFVTNLLTRVSKVLWVFFSWTEPAYSLVE